MSKAKKQVLTFVDVLELLKIGNVELLEYFVTEKDVDLVDQAVGYLPSKQLCAMSPAVVDWVLKKSKVKIIGVYWDLNSDFQGLEAVFKKHGFHSHLSSDMCEVLYYRY